MCRSSRKWVEIPVKGLPTACRTEAIPLCVTPGTAVIFDRRLRHSRSPDHSETTRKAVHHGYGYRYRWIRSNHDMAVGDLCERCDPVRRQLLGAMDGNLGRYLPSDEDVPLRTWLIEQLGGDAVAAMDSRQSRA